MEEMIRLAGAIGFVCAGCNRSGAGVVQNAHGDAKLSPIPFTNKKTKSSWFFFAGGVILFWGQGAGWAGGIVALVAVFVEVVVLV